MRKVVIPGGSGQVGQLLARVWAARGVDVVILSRGGAVSHGRHVAWDGKTLGPWASELDGADVVVNLAGRSVNCRYTPENKAAMMDSRVESTRVVGEAIAACETPPPVWLQMSTATIYDHRYDAANDEIDGRIEADPVPGYDPSWGFSVQIARAWERTAEAAPTPGTRLVLLRSAMVMSPDADGVFDTLRGLVVKGLGGTNGDGRQYVSWIHEHDFVAALDHLIEDSSLEGPVNLAAPNPLPNREFMAALRHATGTRIGLPSTKWMLSIGAVMLRTEVELLLKSRRVVSRRLAESGFTFAYPNWTDAAEELLSRAA
ncbi:MAG: TIGR01777 family oxidoreductase [Sandaracinaceae bacterium]